jgi:hypothetical protein
MTNITVDLYEEIILIFLYGRSVSFAGGILVSSSYSQEQYDSIKKEDGQSYKKQ